MIKIITTIILVNLILFFGCLTISNRLSQVYNTAIQQRITAIDKATGIRY